MQMTKSEMAQEWFSAFLEAHDCPFEFTTRQFVAWIIETYDNPYHVGGVSSYSKFIAHHPGITKIKKNTRNGALWRYDHVSEE